jgi:2-polyprenyl-6-methoxyphenol hydroxylase-like FAD-dependent oxidoreductase
MSARELARRGLSVLLIDAAVFPRTKVCGCCINPRALASLEESGLRHLIHKAAAIPLEGFELASKGRRIQARSSLGFALSRTRFDTDLMEAARDAGAVFEPATRATLLPPETSDRRSLRLTCGNVERVVTVRLVIAAHGLINTLHPGDHHADDMVVVRPGSKIGAGAIVPKVPRGYEPGRIYMACAQEGYVGLVAIENDQFDIAAALRPEAVRRAGGIGPLVEQIVLESGLPQVPEIATLAWKGTPRLTRRVSQLARQRVFRVGDAAGYVEPFTGEGIAWALAGALGLANILSDSDLMLDISAAERRWRDCHRRLVTSRQISCRALCFALRTPWLTCLMLTAMRHRPTLANLILKQVHRA